jgi:hypothetical protein
MHVVLWLRIVAQAGSYCAVRGGSWLLQRHCHLKPLASPQDTLLPKLLLRAAN